MPEEQATPAKDTLMAKEVMVRVDMKNTLALSRRGVEEMRYGPGKNILVPLRFAKALGLEYRKEVVPKDSPTAAPVKEEGAVGDGLDDVRKAVSEHDQLIRALHKEYDEMGDRDDLIKFAAEQDPPVDVRGTGKDGYIKKDDVIAALTARYIAARAPQPE